MNDTMQRDDYARSDIGPRVGRGDGDSVGTLLKQLGHEVTGLVTKELALLKSEARESARTTKAGVAAVATGGAVMQAGLVVLLLAVVYLLSEALTPWLAALIVGVAAMLVGFAMVKSGQRKFRSESLKPERTIDSLRRDKDAVAGRTP